MGTGIGKKIGNLIIVHLIKRKNWFGPINNLVLPEILKFPPLTTVHAVNHWSTNKMIVLMNQYWWGNINEITKSAYLTYPTCRKHNAGKPVSTALQHLKLLQRPFIFHKWISYSFPIHWIKYALVMVCVVPHWTKVFLLDWPLPPLWPKFC